MIHFPKSIKTSLIQRAELHALFIQRWEQRLVEKY